MLVITSEEYVGTLVCVRPIYGWGWHRIDDPSATVDYAQIHSAGSFKVKIEEVFSFDGELRGITGQIHTPGHPFDEYLAVCGTMHAGEYNLRDRLCIRWDLEIGRGQPQGEWPQINSGGPIWGGYGIVAESEAMIDRWFQAQGLANHNAT
jgi:hypothetical protein